MAAADYLSDVARFGNDDPPSGGFSVTASDSADQDPAKPIRFLMVGVTGAVKVTMLNGDVITIPVVTAGIQYRLRIRRIWSTGTTATGLFAFY